MFDRHWKAIASRSGSSRAAKVCRPAPSAHIGTCEAGICAARRRHGSLPAALSVHNSMARMTQKALPADTPYLAQLKTMPSTLIFIMGCHRSGTSLLHHLLAYTGQVNYVTTYDVVHYDSIVSNRITGREAEVKAALQ